MKIIFSTFAFFLIQSQIAFCLDDSKLQQVVASLLERRSICEGAEKKSTQHISTIEARLKPYEKTKSEIAGLPCGDRAVHLGAGQTLFSNLERDGWYLVSDDASRDLVKELYAEGSRREALRAACIEVNILIQRFVPPESREFKKGPKPTFDPHKTST